MGKVQEEHHGSFALTDVKKRQEGWSNRLIYLLITPATHAARGLLQANRKKCCKGKVSHYRQDQTKDYLLHALAFLTIVALRLSSMPHFRSARFQLCACGRDMNCPGPRSQARQPSWEKTE